MSVQALEDAVFLLVNNNFDVDTKACIVTLIKLLDNVIQKQQDEKVRNIRLANPNFHSKVGCRKGGVEYLVACGFVRHRDPPPLLSTEPGEEKLVLKPEMEDQAHLIRARRLLTTRATRDLGIKHDELPTFKPPPPPVQVASAAGSGGGGGASASNESNSFDPYSGHRVDIASAAAGTNLGPDGNYVSRTETQLKKLEKKQQSLEKKMQSNIIDRDWKVYQPNQSVIVETQGKAPPSSSANKPQSDASLIKARLEKQAADKKKAEQFTTKAMRDLEKLQKQSVYTHTLLTIQFSDGCKVLGKFQPKEKIAKVARDLRDDCLVDSGREFDLYIAPPRRVLDLKASLQQEQLVPAAKIYVSWKAPAASAGGGVGSYLKPDLFVSSSAAAAEAFPASAPVAGNNAASSQDKKSGGTDSKKPAAKKESREDTLLRRMMGGSSAGGGGGGGRTTGSSKDASKKPKWFKG